VIKNNRLQINILFLFHHNLPRTYRFVLQQRLVNIKPLR